MTELGLFPLPLVLLPGERVPLHVFEERYKELVGECIAEERDFGLVYASDDGLSEIGTRASVVQVLSRYEDGRLDIVVEGGERFRLLGLTSGRSFQTGDVAVVVDGVDPPEPDEVSHALELFGRLRDLTGSDVEVPAPETEQLSFVLSGRVELAPELKLELLGELSERVRLNRVCELLEAVTAGVEMQRRAAERAMTNGRVELG